MATLLKKIIFLVFLGVLASCSTDNRNNIKSDDKPTKDSGHGDKDKDKDDVDLEDDKADSKTPAAPKHGSESTKELAKLINSGDEERVLNEAGRILSSSPTDERVLNGLGIFYYKNKKPDMAKLFFQRAIKANPENAAAYNNLGVISLDEKEDRKAIEFFKKSVAYDAGGMSAHANLGTIYLKYEDYEKAVEEFTKAYPYFKNNVNIANNFAISLTGAKKYDKALDLYEQLAKSRNMSVALNEAILLAEFKQDNKKARELLNKVRVLSTDPGILKKINDLLKWMERGQKTRE